jgi:integrase/recombinase XerD
MLHLGLNKKGLHIYRHTCAMQLYRKSKDILVTKEKLRHVDIKTTMIYAHAEMSDVVEAMR